MKQIFEEPNCTSCNKSCKTIFSKLTKEQIDYLDEHKSYFKRKRSTILYEEGNKLTGVYCIKSGIVKIYKTGVDGKEQIIKFAKEYDIFGFRSVINGELACHGAKVINDAELCHINKEVFNNILKCNNDFALDMLKLSCSELGEANNYITDIAQKPVKERVAEVIIRLKNDFGTDENGFINLNITREEIANIVGAVTESIIRLLSEFKSKNLIELHGRKIKIVDEDGFKKHVFMLNK